MSSHLTRARVLAQYRGLWLVDEFGLVPARRLPEPPVTGDYVGLDAGGAIACLYDRAGVIVRRAAGTATAAQVLAANVDLALVVEPLPNPNERRLERFIALAGDVPHTVVLTKADLAGPPRPAGLAVSATTGEGLDSLRTLLAPGTTAVILGASGAGKSTLVNALLGEQRQATQPVRASDHRGRHTTVTRELITLPGGASLIDTPGIRVAGLWNGTGESFADVETLAEDCRFSDCAHDTEPGCAVREALDPARLAAWHKLQREQAWVDDRRAASRAREQRGREIARSLRRRPS